MECEKRQIASKYGSLKVVVHVTSEYVERNKRKLERKLPFWEI